jgi:hypothetical protein
MKQTVTDILLYHLLIDNCLRNLFIYFRHNNGAVIARTSQPEVGWLFWRSKEDEKMIQAIITACNSTTTDSASRK